MNFKLQGIISLLVLLLFFNSCSKDAKYTFTYSEPEAKGYSSQKLDLLKNHLEKSGASSMMVIVDGDVVFEWGETSKKHLIHSMRKAILNSLIGIAIEQGEIDTSLTLRELEINDIEPKLSESEQNARIVDLLKSRSGVYHNAAGVSIGMLRDKPERNSFAPGEHYYYNNWDFNTIGAILEKQTGKSIYELFEKEIAIPLGMNDFKGEYCTIDAESEDAEIPDTDGYYQYEKSKSKYPAYHFRMSTRDLALYGLLYMNNGNWNGKQIIPKDWIDISTKPYSIYNPEYRLAYGMLWRVIVPNEDTKRNSFFHTGVGIHVLGVYPELNMVFVHRVDTECKQDYNQANFYKMLRFLFDSEI
jgi:CubicO group peptidase (beta-lactamase class C family)